MFRYSNVNVFAKNPQIKHLDHLKIKLLKQPIYWLVYIVAKNRINYKLVCHTGFYDNMHDVTMTSVHQL